MTASTRVRRRSFIFACFLVVLLLAGQAFDPASALAQGETASVSGRVTDQTNAVIPGVTVAITDVDTGVTYTTKTNAAGFYSFPSVPPGHYFMHVSKLQFRTVSVKDIVLTVQENLSRNFALQIGSSAESITVRGGTSLVDTTNAAVSTVIDRNFIQNMPLNGRSFQTLITLTPGVVLTSTSSTFNQGQFSVNGQRADANDFTIDGVSANFGVVANLSTTQSLGGAIPALSAQGGTNGLLPVDALKEFRVQTSTFAPEYGSMPGGHISMVTRSGTDRFHGTAFEYLRNNVLDANNWFADAQDLPKPKERQNDFGGVFGGPIIRDRAYFFFSYEGLRLRQPQAEVSAVPDLAARQSASAELKPFLDAFPMPNGPELGNGFAQSAAGFSNSSTLDSYSLRIDYRINSRMSLFGRYGYSPSESIARGGTVASVKTKVPVDTQMMTIGLTQAVTPTIANDLRVNYSNQRATSGYILDNFGGAAPPPDNLLFPSGFSSSNAMFSFGTFTSAWNKGSNTVNEQRQVEFVDNLSVLAGVHQLKFGVDYRWLSPFVEAAPYRQFDLWSGGITGPNGVLSSPATVAVIGSAMPVTMLSRNFSLYGQDTWQVTPRLTMTYGLRWDVNPALKGKHSASDPFGVTGVSRPATLALAPQGKPLYRTTYGNVAPRLGVAYEFRKTPRWETVFRAGGGVFYDLGSGSLGTYSSAWPFLNSEVLFNVPFPLTPQEATPPAFNPVPPTMGYFYTSIPNLKLPRTYEWNLAFEQSLGPAQALTVSYVGAIGRDLLRAPRVITPNAQFQGAVILTNNSGRSDYQALQIQFQRRLSHGLGALVSYTFSHSIDNGSIDSDDFQSTTSPLYYPNGVALDWGNSNFDVRHSVTGGITYALPAPRSRGLVRGILGGWSADTFLTARSALPLTVGGSYLSMANYGYLTRPDVVPGTPPYLYGSQYPGGKALNPAAFVAPPTGQQGNLGRNSLRGFGLWQVDFAMQKSFHLTERVGLAFRAEFFNLFNHPNFANPDSTIGDPLFGQSIQTLASGLGSAYGGLGLSSLYQVGGPRSGQLSLQLQF